MVTGEISLVRGLSYSLGLDYAFGHQQPYVVGPNQGVPRYLVSTPTVAQLAPVNPMTAFIGFEFTMDAKPPGTQEPTETPEPSMRAAPSPPSTTPPAGPTLETPVPVDPAARPESP